MTIRQYLEKRLAAAKARHGLVLALGELFKAKYSGGKKLTARIEQQLADLTGFDREHIRFMPEYGLLYISVWGKSTPWPDYNSRERLFLGYESEKDLYTLETWAKHSPADWLVTEIADLSSALESDWPERLAAARTVYQQEIEAAEDALKSISRECKISVPDEVD
jgi:hypothetical protein